jgi:hypothetical protein
LSGAYSPKASVFAASGGVQCEEASQLSLR